MAESERVVRWRVSGRVQGVGFRWFTVEAARRHGVRGRVRNLEDGAVQVDAVGSELQLASFFAEVRRGPRWASVTGVEELEGSRGTEDWRGFDVDF